MLEFKGNTEKEKKSVVFESETAEKDKGKSTKEVESLEKIKADLTDRLTSEINEWKKERNRQMEIIEEWKKERKRQNEIMEEWKRKEMNWEIRMRVIEEKFSEIEKEIRDVKEKVEEDDSHRSVRKEEIDWRSKVGGSSYAGSVTSGVSVGRLSVREVGKLRNWISHKEKDERRNNIVIKGIKDAKELKQIKEDPKRWARFFLKTKLGLDSMVGWGRVSNQVIIVGLDSEEEKKEVMRNKNKLKGENIFIENDLTWEERKIQERISRWAKERRGKGEEIKIGLGKVRIGGTWKLWREIEKEMEEEEERTRLGSQDVEFWNFIKEYDYIGLCETWLTEKGWENIKNRLPDSHQWVSSHAMKKKGKGRAIGGIVVGIRKDWRGKEWERMETGYDNIIHMRTKEVNENLNIIIMYNNGNSGKEVGETITKVMKESEKERLIVGGDFNIRIGNLGGDEGEGGVERKSKDKMIGNGGRKFIDSMIENGLNVLNGRTNGDWDGEFTYVGARGSTVIDYVFVNELIVDKVTEFKVEERVDSDHMPVCMKMEEMEETEEEEERDGRRKMKLKKQEKKVIEKKRICWDPEAIEKYKAKTEEIGWNEEQERISLDRKWNKLKNLVQEAMTKKVYKIKKRKIGHKDWWDKSCTRRKRE
ncbi:uncharacterized protein LOC109857707, partial [Pseudomyrmex gracilis]|uniref:uncharacterized protein LOC109857707 n=1 Tax=Pseudomyrmex gracilis TaxID=219809 RepID=UPI0009951CC5